VFGNTEMVPSPIPHLPCEDEEETDKPPAVPGTGPSLSLSPGSIMQLNSH